MKSNEACSDVARSASMADVQARARGRRVDAVAVVSVLVSSELGVLEVLGRGRGGL